MVKIIVRARWNPSAFFLSHEGEGSGAGIGGVEGGADADAKAGRRSGVMPSSYREVVVCLRFRLCNATFFTLPYTSNIMTPKNTDIYNPTSNILVIRDIHRRQIFTINKIETNISMYK